MIGSLVAILAAVVSCVAGAPGLSHHTPRFRGGDAVPAAPGSLGELTFKAGWDSANNNNHGRMTKDDIYSAIYTNCASADFKAAVDCKFVTVTKGCHKPAPHSHITVEFEERRVEGDCAENPFYGGPKVHMSCTSCDVRIQPKKPS